MQIGHCVEGEVPFSVGRATDHFGVLEGLMVVEPVIDHVVFFFIELHVDGLKWFHFEYVVPIIQGSLFVVERRKPDSFEMPSISFLPSHHDPHCAPLSGIDRFNHSRNLIYETNCTGDVIEDLDVSDLLPGHGSVF